MKPHQFCILTYYCTRCGCSLLDHRNAPRVCDQVGNVLGISHIISAARLHRLCGSVII